MKPRLRLIFPIGFLQMRPYLPLVPRHLNEPILAGFRIVSSADPPLSFNRQVSLKVQQQIRAGHRPACKEMLRHPTTFEIVRRLLVTKVMHEELTAGLERSRDFGEQELVVLHVLEKLNGHNTVILIGLKVVLRYVARDTGEIGEGRVVGFCE